MMALTFKPFLQATENSTMKTVSVDTVDSGVVYVLDVTWGPRHMSPVE